MVVVWSRRKNFSAKKLKRVDDSSISDRNSCGHTFLVFRSEGTAMRPSATTIATNWPRNRTQTTWLMGNCDTEIKYLAVASTQLNKAMAMHIKAMALTLLVFAWTGVVTGVAVGRAFCMAGRWPCHRILEVCAA